MTGKCDVGSRMESCERERGHSGSTGDIHRSVAGGSQETRFNSQALALLCCCSLGCGQEGKLGGGQTGTPCTKLPLFWMFWVMNPIQKQGSTCRGCKSHVQIEDMFPQAYLEGDRKARPGGGKGVDQRCE